MAGGRSAPSRPVLVLFVDGIGWGVDDPAVNPFAHADLPHLSALLGRRPVLDAGSTELPALALDATMGVAGMPQSGTGQAALITGRNVAAAVGGHRGPFADATVQAILSEHSLWRDARARGASARLATAYPDALIERVARGAGRLSGIARAAVQSGVPLLGRADVVAGGAVPPFLGAPRSGARDRPVVDDPFDAGQRLAAIAARHALTVHEHFGTDVVGHRGDLAAAVDALRRLDAFWGGVMAAWPADHVLVLMSDHGNLEDTSTTQHTLAPAIGAWRGPWPGGPPPASVTEIAPAVRRALGWAALD